MAARKQSASKKSASKKSASSKSRSKSSARSTGGSQRDAIALLRADHQKVEGLLEQFEKARGEGRKGEIAEQICQELTVHAQVEEEIFYPAARDALRESDGELLDEATVEHASAKDLIAQIEGASPGDELFDAKVKVLGEYVQHHVKEEQNELFPKLRKTKLDLKELGARIEARKLELEEGGTAGGGRSGGAMGARSSGELSGTRRAERATSKAGKGKDRQQDGILDKMARGMGFSGQ